MTKETMTVHQALCELKVADKKIRKQTDFNYCYTRKGKENTVSGRPVAEVEDEIRANFQRFVDITNRVNAIKAALSLSNAKTVITVAGKNMTVAEAIYLNNHGIEAKKTFVRELLDEYSVCKNHLDEMNEKLESRCDKAVADMYGTDGAKKNTKEAEEYRKTFYTQNALVLVDPLNIPKVAQKLQDEIDEFEAAVDAAIQMSNATTTIEIEY